MYQYVLFDLDGTLTDPKEGITKCVQYALNKYGIQEELENLVCFIGPPLLESFMVYYGMEEEQGKEAIDFYRERFSTVGMFENIVYKGIDQLLQRLKERGVILAVATSKPTIYSKKILERFELSKYFDVIVGSELDGSRCVKAEVIEEVFQQLHITEDDKNQVIMIGDRKHDIIGANTCGVSSIGVSYGYSEENELEEAGATYVVHSVDELQALLLKELC